MGLACFVFALCFAGVPIYRTFCEHMGLIGDSNKKEYSFDGKQSKHISRQSTISKSIKLSLLEFMIQM